MGLPYYKRFPRDFMEGTIGLSFEEKGAYGLVLDLIYMRDGRLPDDPRYIAGHLGCSVRKWNTIRAALIQAGKLVVRDGVISNSRADYLTEETRKYQEQQAENRSRPKKNNTLAERPSDQSESEPDISPPNPPEGKVSLRAFAKALELYADASMSFSELAFLIHRLQPTVGGRRRSALVDVETALSAAMKRGGRPSQIVAALRTYYALPASVEADGKYASGAAVVLNKDRWREYLAGPGSDGEAEPEQPRQVFDGPRELREWVVGLKGEGFARSWLDGCRWEAEGRRLIARNAFVSARLQQELGPHLQRARVTVAVASGNDDRARGRDAA